MLIEQETKNISEKLSMGRETIILNDVSYALKSEY
jgi:hypothetical protein